VCGIAGILRLDGGSVRHDELVAMARALQHRGPDGEGFALLGDTATQCRFCNADDLRNVSLPSRCGLAHRRLAIIDLSPAGIQPMRDETGEVWLVYNGEIFNYLELRAELESHGRRFRTATDSEVLLQAYDEWGPDCLHRLNGMWAFAIWDTRRRVLFLARDRFGIKPFYYVFVGGRFAFASEPKALLKLDWVSKEPDDRAVADFLVHSREDCFEWTFFKGIKRLEPGCYMNVKFDDTELPAPAQWWNINDALSPPPLSDTEAQERFRELFESAVRLRLRSDVPVGTCLSGGLDSSAVVCVARPWLKEENQKVFSAVYSPAFKEDEARYIDEVIKATGVQGFRTYPTGETLLEDLERFIYHQDEPFGSTSQYAQFKVFELVRKCGTTVTLDGQGADEELAGYAYFFPVHFAALLRKLRLASAWSEFRRCIAVTGARAIPMSLATAAGFLSHRAMIRWANRYDPSRTIDWVRAPVVKLAQTIRERRATEFGDLLNRRLYETFAVSSLPALLRYEDRNSMAFSVEARLPFLDYRLVSYLFSLPADQKIRGGWTKYVMRQALKGVIPESIRTRTDKIGFATPEAQWFRTSMLDYLRSLFSSARTRDRGLYDTARLLALLERNAAGQVEAGRAIWRAACLELWFRRFID
jgi:asparagine synthase (glutamine-hydrolysing)